ncbi:MAG: hypothetical protein LQ340_001281 [Diploschistes diacapsis]|nr:MAG: hypothetical protein LQ340_001281 [Diploschistes diacapsis]
MPLTPYQYRPITPPTAAAVPELIEEGLSPNFSESSAWTTHSSPNLVEVHVETTPFDRSPIRQHGPALLPKIRTQDQSHNTSTKGHRRAVSQSYVPPPTQARPPFQRSTTVPPEYNNLLSPFSATSTSTNFSFGVLSNVASPVGAGHSRSVSASSVDSVTLNRFGYPYRRQPAYISGAYWSPSVIPGSAIFTAQAATPRQALYYDLPEEQRCEQADEVTMTSLEYMRAANPAVNLVRQVNRTINRLNSHFWWDVRNIDSWDDFTLETIMAVPGFEKLLSIPVNDSAFPKPQISSARLFPESEAALVDIIKDFYMAKLNATMKVTQGSRYTSMRLNKDRDGPAFLSNYQDDYEKTITGNGRGRIVGIVRPYERWNSGMRNEQGWSRILYLEGLAALHFYMRQHQCRYGYIMTETELVCARAGTGDMPYFGHLELAPVIETRCQEGLTANLALWFLHMLAKEEPLPGQCSWRINVGAPAAMTRQHVLAEKDTWIPEPNATERRDAKRIRGWTFPKDPWNKKREGGKAWNK